MSQITIVGAHGQVAQFLGARLASDHRVRGLVRKREQFDELEALGVVPVLFDLESSTEDDYKDAFADQDVVIFAAGAGGSDVSRTYAVDRDAAIKAVNGAAGAGVSRFVLLSTIASGQPEQVPAMADYLTAKGAADDHLQTMNDLAWVIVRPGTLSNDDPTGTITLGAGPDTVEGQPIPRADVAHVVATVATMQVPHRTIFTVFGGSTAIDDAIAGI